MSDNDFSPLENLFTVCLYFAMWPERGYSKFEQGSRDETEKHIANRCGINISFFRNHIKLYENKIFKKKKSAELTPLRKKILEKYLNFKEEDFYLVVSDLLAAKGDVFKQEISKNVSKEDKNMVRYFNDEGNELYVMEFFQAALDEENKYKINENLLFDSKYTETLEGAKEIDKTKKFNSRFELGKYLYEVLKDCKQENLTNNSFLWNWLTLFYFNQLFPGIRGGKQDIRYILSENPFYRYRHLVRESWSLYNDFGQDSFALLTKEVNNGSDEIEATSSNYELLNSNFLKFFKELYIDEAGPKPYLKSKVLENSLNEPGSLRRLKINSKRLSLNFVIEDMSYNDYKKILLKFPEFKKWL